MMEDFVSLVDYYFSVDFRIDNHVINFFFRRICFVAIDNFPFSLVDRPLYAESVESHELRNLYYRYLFVQCCSTLVMR
jgi:hypothetical protein